LGASEFQSADGDAIDPALADHFETYRGEILGFLRSRVANVEQAEDLLQQTFLRVLQRANWAAVNNPRAYLKTAARHVLSDFYRSRNARNQNAFVEFDDDRHLDETWSPGRSSDSDDELRQLAAAIATLSAPVQRAFVLSRVYGHTYAEVGRLMNLSPRTIEKHVAKGLATCFRYMVGTGAGKGAEEEHPKEDAQ
jgi:RNA polymerase sigma-70 factor (ECF subfamily)